MKVKHPGMKVEYIGQGVPGECSPLYSRLIQIFMKKPTSHLARCIFVDCNVEGVEVPKEVTEFLIKDMRKKMEDYEEEHPGWGGEINLEHAFRFTHITTAIMEAKLNGESEASVFRKFSKGYNDTEAWKLLRKRYKDYLKKT